MRAASVTDLGQPPRYSTFEDPIAQEDEVLVRPTHAAISNLAKVRASGKHNSDDSGIPFVAGIDGVGLWEDGTRVYFAFPRVPFGTMAEIVPVRRDYIVPLPADLDSAIAAGIVGGKLSERTHDDSAPSLSLAHANKFGQIVQQFAEARLRTDVCHGR